MQVNIAEVTELIHYIRISPTQKLSFRNNPVRENSHESVHPNFPQTKVGVFIQFRDFSFCLVAYGISLLVFKDHDTQIAHVAKTTIVFNKVDKVQV